MTSMPDAYTASTTSRLSKPAGPIPPGQAPWNPQRGSQMPFRRYNVLTFVGNALWCFALAGAGWALGRSYQTFHHDFRYAEYLVVAAILALIVLVIVRHRRASRLTRRAEDPAR